MIKAEIVADSLSPQGDRLTSLLITFPRFILAEVNTHRMLSKNTSSSRAIPFNKMVEAVQNDPFIPIAWQKEHKGMQGSEYIIDEENIQTCIDDWLLARNSAIESAQILNKGFNKKDEQGNWIQTEEIDFTDKVTKQLCNRLLEPFMWTTMLITGSKEGWDNFFNLRCPSYKLIGLDEENVKSRKEWLEKIQFSSALHPSMYPKTDVEWLQINKGQAEIHIMDLAEKIYDAVNESTPKQLQAGEWHIPMISDLESLKLSTDDQIKLSVGRAANTSYTVVGDEKELTLEHAIKIHDKCVELVHSSVFEHCARAMSDEEYYSFIKGKVKTGYIDESEHQIFLSNKSHNWGDYSELGWCNNLKGFIPYRYFIDNKIEI